MAAVWRLPTADYTVGVWLTSHGNRTEKAAARRPSGRGENCQRRK